MKISRLMLVLSLVGFMAIGCFLGEVRADIKAGLVSAWTFNDGSGKDLTGKYDGVANGGVKAAAGKYGGGMDFNGKDGFVEVKDGPGLKLPGDLTVAGWMNVRKGNNHAAICWKGEKIGWGPLFNWRVATTADKNMTWGRTAGGTEAWFATDGVIDVNKWIHVALTTGAAGSKSYVDGTDVTGKTGQGDNTKVKGPYNTFDGKPVEIGVGRGIDGVAGRDFYFDGMIDEVYIYSRELSAADIKELMDSDTTKGGVAVELKGKLAASWGDLKRR